MRCLFLYQQQEANNELNNEHATQYSVFKQSAYSYTKQEKHKCDTKCGGDKKKKLNPKEEGMEIGSESSHVSSFHINI